MFSCSDSQYFGICKKFLDSDDTNKIRIYKKFLDSADTYKIRNYNPHKYDLIRKLMNQYIKSVEKIGDSEITIHEKRKTLEKTQVGETVFNLITNLILPCWQVLKYRRCF